MIKLQVIGGGNMGEALLGGLIANGWASPAELYVVEKLAARREELSARHPSLRVGEEAVAAEACLVAVKPNDVAAACAAVAGVGAGELRRVLSIAAGVTTSQLEGSLGLDDVAVVRAMPNTPALIGQGAAAIAPGSAANEADLAWAEEILSAVGTVVRVTESQLDAVTGLSGSGPAYVFLVAEALIEAGVLVGLARPVAERLAVQTLVGSALLLAEGQAPAELRAAVTSPGGTTAAGLRVLEQRAVRAAFLDAVAAATERSAELGRS